MSLKDQVAKLIEKEINLPFAVLSILAVILIRACLELFSSPWYLGDIFSAFFIFLNFPLYFCSVIFSLVLITYYFTGLEFKKVFNLGVLFSSVILLPPIIDLIVSGGRGLGMAYLFFDSFSEMLPSLLSFFGKFIEPGITLGIRIEVVLVLAGIAYLTYLKSKSFKKTIFALVVSYLVLFFLFSFPSIFAILFGNIDYYRVANQPAGSAAYQSLSDLLSNSLANGVHNLQGLPTDKTLLFNQQLYILINRLLWLIVLAQSVWLFYLGAPKVFKAWLKNLRWERVFYYWAISILGLFISFQWMSIDYSFNPVDILGLIVFFILVALSFWLAVGINDLYDIETDSISSPNRPLAIGTITVGQQNLINLFLGLFILMGLATINYAVLVLLLVFQAVYFIYSVPPLRLKRIFGLSSLLVGFNALLVMMAGFYFIAPIQKISFFPKHVLAMALFSFTLVAGIKDIKDYEGDKTNEIMTIPVVFGLKWGKRILGALAVLALLAVAWLTSLKSIAITSLIFSPILFVLINREDYEERPIFSAFFIYAAICVISLILKS
ncbi:UbiA family prenyltransferase [Patescibacteria group bacterium]|nr:UbiA family prenyltransferase [Patescibacteria group bacterium]MBU2219924.1 UbiA family prenyltransferase [Patescibacteria group bacterium]